MLHHPSSIENTAMLAEFELTDQHHSDEIANCLVDLHGTCLVLPFHREGLPYLSLLVIAILQMVVQSLRITAREINSPNPPNDISEWHLLLGRFGLLCFTLATALDHLRLACGAWDASWPAYIVTASNATVANDLWMRHGYGGATAQKILWWYCCFLQLIMLPATLFSISYIYIKARLRLRLRLHNMRMKQYFIYSGALVLFFLFMGLLTFFMGPVQAPMQVVRVTGLWSLTTTSELMVIVAIVTLLVWHGSLIALAISLWYLEGSSKRLANTVFLLVVTVSFVMCCGPLVSETKGDDSSSCWLAPLVTKFLLQLAIGSHMWADITHNPDDFGRLNDDMYRFPTATSLRQPLLPSTNLQQNNEHDEDDDDDEQSHGGEDGQDDMERGGDDDHDDEPSELEESESE